MIQKTLANRSMRLTQSWNGYRTEWYVEDGFRLKAVLGSLNAAIRYCETMGWDYEVTDRKVGHPTDE